MFSLRGNSTAGNFLFSLPCLLKYLVSFRSDWIYPLVRSSKSLGVGLDPLRNIPGAYTDNHTKTRSNKKYRNNTFQAISYDLYGKAGVLHERIKEPIAQRLASAEANIVYGVS